MDLFAWKDKLTYQKFIKPILFTTGLIFLALLVIHSWGKLQHLLTTIHWPVFILSVLIGCLVNLFTSYFFKELLYKYGINATSSLAHKIFFYAQVAKYIPGKVWLLFYQAMLIKTAGGTTSAILFANLDLTAIAILMTATMAGSLISLNYSLILSGLFLIIGLILCVWVGKFCYFFVTTNYILIYIKGLSKISCSCQPKITKSTIVAYYLFFCMGYLISYFLMMLATFNFSMAQSANYIAYLSLAWIAGVLSFLVPSGLGIKELVFIMLAHTMSQHNISLEMLSAIAVISRFWSILQELIGISLIFLVNLDRQLKVN